MVRTSPSSARGEGLIPSQGPTIPHALQPKNQNIKQKQYCNKFIKTLKMVHIKKILKKQANIKLYCRVSVYLFIIYSN